MKDKSTHQFSVVKFEGLMPLSKDSHQSHRAWTPGTWEAFWPRISELQGQGDTKGISSVAQGIAQKIQLEDISP